MSVWQREARFGHAVLLWACLSLVGGSLLIRFAGPWWQGFGVQAVVWGTILGLGASWQLRRLRRRLARGYAGLIEYEWLEREHLQRLRRFGRILGLGLLLAAGALGLLTAAASGLGAALGVAAQGIAALLLSLLGR